MLVRMLRKGNPPTLLVGMQAHAATLESSMKVSQKVEIRATDYNPAIALLETYPR